MCQHNVVEGAGVDTLQYWKEDILCVEQFEVVKCNECHSTFLLDDLIE